MLQGVARQRKESIKQIKKKKQKNASRQYKLTERNYGNVTRSVNFPN